MKAVRLYLLGLFLASAAMLLPTSARADLHVGAALGGLAPWDGSGNAGLSVAGQILGGGFGDRLRLGAEFEYRNYEISMLGVDDVNIDSYDVRALIQLVPFPDRLSPYAGLGIGLKFIDLDDRRVDDALAGAGLSVSTFGLAAGGIGYVGLQLPLTEFVSLFAEGRFDVSWELTDDFQGGLNPSDLGAITGMAGVRLRF